MPGDGSGERVGRREGRVGWRAGASIQARARAPRPRLCRCRSRAEAARAGPRSTPQRHSGRVLPVEREAAGFTSVCCRFAPQEAIQVMAKRQQERGAGEGELARAGGPLRPHTGPFPAGRRGAQAGLGMFLPGHEAPPPPGEDGPGKAAFGEHALRVMRRARSPAEHPGPQTARVACRASGKASDRTRTTRSLRPRRSAAP